MKLSALESWVSKQGPALPPGTRLSGLDPMARGLVLAAASRESQSPHWVIVESAAEAHALIEAIALFAPLSDRTHYVPAIEFDFHRAVLPGSQKTAERLSALTHAVKDPKGRIFVVPHASLFQRTLAVDLLKAAVLELKIGQDVDRDTLIRWLLGIGYERQPIVNDVGSFAVRGGVVDIYSALYSKPIRLDFFGDTLESIHTFHPSTQRSMDSVAAAAIGPVTPCIHPSVFSAAGQGENNADFEAVAARIKRRLDDIGVAKADRDAWIDCLHRSAVPKESAFLFPVVLGGSASLLDYINDSSVVWADLPDTWAAVESEFGRLKEHHELFEKNHSMVAEFDALFDSINTLKARIENADHLLTPFVGPAEGEGIASQPLGLRSVRERAKRAGDSSLEEFAKLFRAYLDEGYAVHVGFHTHTQRDRFKSLFEPYGLVPTVRDEAESLLDAIGHSKGLSLWLGHVGESVVWPNLRQVLLSEEAVFGAKKRTVASRVPSERATTRLLEIFRRMEEGDFVVHKEFGIGRYLGLKTMPFLGEMNDYVLLEYRDADRLYIPIYRLNVLQKYVSADGPAPVLDKLGTDRWNKAQGRAKRAIAELAAELIQMQARRKLVAAPVLNAEIKEYAEFESEFPYDETPDQATAINDVRRDLSEPHAMDRLICGDVGYGKTEIAMRAAMQAVLNKKQVAILVPTTVLAFQHFETFRERFRRWPVRIEWISRMRESKQIPQVLKDTREGKVDILIGTHRILSADTVFSDLGLVVIDEEHRFGVTHKEKLKKLKASVHVLTLTATPIPRTLHMAVGGLKDISVIATAPPDRLAVRTFVCRTSNEIIHEAVTNELARNGQVYFVHNRVESLPRVAEELHALLPGVRIEVAHGQMEGPELERKMLRFYRNEVQVLLCTTIIESGLDIAAANTIIIDRADCLGLAQLYQLRGRVGRSSRRAYCYLLTPEDGKLTEEGKQRLQILQRYSSLGSGFQVANHDLEQRGAGDLLGRDQAGHIHALGVELYFELLEQSVAELKGHAPEIQIDPEIFLPIQAAFPMDYLPDVSERVELYRRLSGVRTQAHVAELEGEIRDRFGALPVPVLNLLGLVQIKLRLQSLHCVRMYCGPKRTSLQFADSTPVPPEAWVRLVQAHPKRYTLTPDQKLVFNHSGTGWQEQLKQVDTLLSLLGIDIFGLG